MLYRVGREVLSRNPHLMVGVLGAVAKLVPQGVRYGREFRKTRRFLQKSQWWTPEQHAAYQLTKLKETLEYAYHNIPFYRESFTAHGVSPDDLKELADIRRFPMMDKDTLLANYDRIHAMEGDNLMPFCTGGTTGSGVWLRFEESFRQREQAFIWHNWNRVGYKHGMLAAILQHRECPPDLNDGIWYMDRVSNAMILSAQRLTLESVERYLRALEDHGPRILIAYPSLAYLFATYAKQIGWTKKIFDMILCGSETLYGFQRRHIEEVLQAPVRIHYGHIESCALFGYCLDSNVYHVQTEYGYVEVLRESGVPAEAGESGEIVGTSFDNRSVPLIRFRTRDVARVGEGTCSCGRSYPLIDRIEGREGDFIQSPSGKVHSPIVIEFLIDGRVGFADLQIVQNQLDEVVVKVVPAHNFTQSELDLFCTGLSEKLEHEVRVVPEFVDEIPRTSRQKKSLIVSSIPVR